MHLNLIVKTNEICGVFLGLQASAKRFRVTGSGKIMRRRAGKQHLLAKKNSKRKLRLSKMVSFLLEGLES